MALKYVCICSVYTGEERMGSGVESNLEPPLPIDRRAWPEGFTCLLRGARNLRVHVRIRTDNNLTYTTGTHACTQSQPRPQPCQPCQPCLVNTPSRLQSIYRLRMLASPAGHVRLPSLSSAPPACARARSLLPPTAWAVNAHMHRVSTNSHGTNTPERPNPRLRPRSS